MFEFRGSRRIEFRVLGTTIWCAAGMQGMKFGFGLTYSFMYCSKILHIVFYVRMLLII